MTDILYVPDLAAKLGISPEAVRIHLRRRTGGVPPSFRIGRRHAWHPADFDKWLQDKRDKAANQTRPRRGRPRKIETL